MVFSLLLEGSMFRAIFQRKRVSLRLSFSFQRSFQVLDSRGDKLEEILGELINLYAKQVENRPLEEEVQRKEGELLRLIGIFKISLTQEVVNRETRKG